MEVNNYWLLPSYMVAGGYCSAGITTIIFDGHIASGIFRIILSLLALICLFRFEQKRRSKS